MKRADLLHRLRAVTASVLDLFEPIAPVSAGNQHPVEELSPGHCLHIHSLFSQSANSGARASSLRKIIRRFFVRPPGFSSLPFAPAGTHIVIERCGFEGRRSPDSSGSGVGNPGRPS